MTVRACDGCRACCTALGVDAIGKPTDAPCPHECSSGCSIYTTRPEPCAAFLCAWAQGFGRNMERPDRVGFVLVPTRTGEALVAHPAHPGALEEPQVRARLDELAKKLVIILRLDERRRTMIGPAHKVEPLARRIGRDLTVIR